MKQNIKISGIISVKDFSKKIEDLVSVNKLTYMDAVLYFCEKTGMEIEVAAMLIKNSNKIKSKVRIDGEDLNILSKTSRLKLDD